MSETPKGYHDAEVWLQVEGKTRTLPSWEAEAGTIVVDSIKVAAHTQSRPNPPRKGCIAVKVTLRIPDGAFLPFAPEAVITVPENMVVRGPIEADVAGAGEIPHAYIESGLTEGRCGNELANDDRGFECGMPEADPIHTKDD